MSEYPGNVQIAKLRAQSVTTMCVATVLVAFIVCCCVYACARLHP